MRLLLIVACVLVVAPLAFVGLRLFLYPRLLPRPSAEIVQLTPDKRAHLQRLRAENKFQPHEYPPGGYTGAESPREKAQATAAVDAVIDAILARSDGPVPASEVSALIGQAMRRVNLLPTEDRDRTADYVVEIWYIIGFRGATGPFAPGPAFPKPDGYGEPLPPGWSAPDKPRRIE